MSPPSDDEDALLDALDSESDPALAPYRAQRLQQLATELARAKELRSQDHGTYTEIRDEKALMDIVTGTRRCVVHFFKPDFGRCGLMDVHLEVNAPMDGRISINVLILADAMLFLESSACTY